MMAKSYLANIRQRYCLISLLSRSPGVYSMFATCRVLNFSPKPIASFPAQQLRWHWTSHLASCKNRIDPCIPLVKTFNLQPLSMIQCESSKKYSHSFFLQIIDLVADEDDDEPVTRKSSPPEPNESASLETPKKDEPPPAPPADKQSIPPMRKSVDERLNPPVLERIDSTVSAQN